MTRSGLDRAMTVSWDFYGYLDWGLASAKKRHPLMLSDWAVSQGLQPWRFFNYELRDSAIAAYKSTLSDKGNADESQ